MNWRKLKFTANPFGTVVVLFIFGVCFMLFDCANAQGVDVELYHTSSGGSTDTNRGDNYLMGCYVSPTGLRACLGRYFIGSSSCATGMSLSQEFGKHWEARITTRGEMDCVRHGTLVVDNQGQITVGVMRIVEWKRFQLGIGAGVRESGDLSVGDGQDPFLRDDDPQLVANLLIRFGAWRR